MTTTDRPVVNEHVDGFDIGDLFMSRTDPRGVIRSGNGTFCRLAGYPWSDLVGAPHKIIRHPDMPRATFWLMWDLLKKGEVFAAYVKNLAADGRYYWVFAFVMPVDTGYVSVRLKPTTEILGTVEALYKRLRHAELHDGASIEDGVMAMRAAMDDLGFRNYRDFVSHALCAEYSSRRAALGMPVDPGIAALQEVGKMISTLYDEIDQVMQLFKQISGSPGNLRIQSARLGGAALPVTVIAQNYTQLSDRLRSEINRMASTLTDMHRSAQAASLGYAASKLLSEAIPVFAEDEDFLPSVDRNEEIGILHGANDGFQRRLRSTCRQILGEARAFTEVTRHLKMVVSGLAVTRVMCKIESAVITGDTSGIEEISRRLDDFQVGVSAALDRILAQCTVLTGQLQIAAAVSETLGSAGRKSVAAG